MITIGATKISETYIIHELNNGWLVVAADFTDIFDTVYSQIFCKDFKGVLEYLKKCENGGE